MNPAYFDYSKVAAKSNSENPNSSGGVNSSLKAHCYSKPQVRDFFEFMSLCHSVMVDHDPNTLEILYQASSPDELALVKASNEVGIKLVERTGESIIIEENEVKSEHKILAEFPFDSDRKRMSVIIERNGKYFLYCKGADSIMEDRIKWKQGEKEIVFRDLNKFAIEGLRTLVMSKKELSAESYKQFSLKSAELQSSSLRNKDELLFEVYNQLEKDLDFVGASAIEDRLQDEVPQTIAKLMEADIRLWVLTGDKQETAIEIAKSCQLIQEGMKVEILTIDFGDIPNPKTKVPDLLEHIKQLKKAYRVDDSARRNGYKDVKLISELSLVVDGPTLEIILGHSEVEQEFFSLALYASSVVC